MRPFCDEEISVIGVICVLIKPFGPMFSYQDKSVRWVAMFWLNFRLVVGSRR